MEGGDPAQKHLTRFRGFLRCFLIAMATQDTGEMVYIFALIPQIETVSEIRKLNFGTYCALLRNNHRGARDM